MQKPQPGSEVMIGSMFWLPLVAIYLFLLDLFFSLDPESSSFVSPLPSPSPKGARFFIAPT